MRLGGHIQGGGRLIENDQPWPQDKCQGQHHPLLLTTGKLMGKAPQEVRIGRQADIAQGVENTLLLRHAVQAHLMHRQGFAQQPANAQRRVQSGGRVLGDVADQAAPGAAQGLTLQFQQGLPGHFNAPGNNPRTASGVG